MLLPAIIFSDLRTRFLSNVLRNIYPITIDYFSLKIIMAIITAATNMIIAIPA
jgi:hypothetical protein